jgi:antitoxin component YwqK of YwqJK toxin-antitoxin module
MKSKPFSLFISLLLAVCAVCRTGFAQAQPGTIRVTSTLHSDGTRTDMQTNADEHTAESKTYNQAGKLMQRIVFKLDDQGIAVTASLYSAKNVLVSKAEYKHDGMNRVTEVLAYTPYDKLISRQVYHYDGKGKVTGIDAYDAAGNLIKSTSQTDNLPKKGGTPGRMR